MTWLIGKSSLFIFYFVHIDGCNSIYDVNFCDDGFGLVDDPSSKCWPMGLDCKRY